MNKRVLLIGSVLALALLALLGFGFESLDGTLRHDPNIIDSPLIGKPATSFALADFDGNIVDFADLRGKPIVLNFWASWCQPCIYEHPLLVRAAREYAGRVHFVGVVPREDRQEAVDRFQSQLGSWGPALHDRDGKVSIAYGVYKLPETYFIGSDGIIREKIAGPVGPDSLSVALEELL